MRKKKSIKRKRGGQPRKFCPRGHNKDRVGRLKDGKCKKCYTDAHFRPRGKKKRKLCSKGHVIITNKKGERYCPICKKNYNKNYFRKFRKKIVKQHLKYYNTHRKEVLLQEKKRRQRRSKKEKMEIALQNKKYFQEHKSEIRRNSSLYRKGWKLVEKYKMTLEDYDKLSKKQHRRCAGCNRHQKEFKNLFGVDHDHKCCRGAKSCGKCVRGLLCSTCNWALGNVQDNIETLKRLIKYLRKWK
jgi:hypothetical protein